MALFSKIAADGEKMAKDQGGQPPRDTVISIIAPGMRVVGDCDTDGTLRIEGTIEGTVRAGKAVVVGKEGVVLGDIRTQDAVIGGQVTGTIIAESRLELQPTAVINGEIRARRVKLDEGGTINGNIHMTEQPALPAPAGVAKPVQPASNRPVPA